MSCRSRSEGVREGRKEGEGGRGEGVKGGGGGETLFVLPESLLLLATSRSMVRTSCPFQSEYLLLLIDRWTKG